MTDETRKQIEKDAHEHEERALYNGVPWAKENFIVGATHQHPIGVKEGWYAAAIMHKDLLAALKDCMRGCADAIDMFEGSDEEGQKRKAEIQGYYNNGRKVIKQFEALKK